MKKTRIKINPADYPADLQFFFENAGIYDSSCSPNARVLYSDLGYYLKIAKKDTLAKEAELTQLFYAKEMGPELISYFSLEKDYMLTRSAQGEDATHWLEEPEKVCEVLAEVMKDLHGMPVQGFPVSISMEEYAALEAEKKTGIKLQQDTLIHGDFCLPNVMIDKGKFTTLIDLGQAGVGDRHIDLYWAMWSLRHNLKIRGQMVNGSSISEEQTDQYLAYFADLYGREKIEWEILEKIAELEK